jgi:hypothetical protein
VDSLDGRFASLDSPSQELEVREAPTEVVETSVQLAEVVTGLGGDFLLGTVSRFGVIGNIGVQVS